MYDYVQSFKGICHKLSEWCQFHQENSFFDWKCLMQLESSHTLSSSVEWKSLNTSHTFSHIEWLESNLSSLSISSTFKWHQSFWSYVKNTIIEMPSHPQVTGGHPLERYVLLTQYLYILKVHYRTSLTSTMLRLYMILWVRSFSR